VPLAEGSKAVADGPLSRALWLCRITFETQRVREAASLVASASRDALDSARKIAIGQTLVPSHMDRERFGSSSAFAEAACSGPPHLSLRSPMDDDAAAAAFSEPCRPHPCVLLAAPRRALIHCHRAPLRMP
jgi:hypothetical protein